MIIVRSLNFGERDATLIDFLFEENSKLAPKACLRNSLSGFSSSYTGSMKSIGRLICEISAKYIGVTENTRFSWVRQSRRSHKVIAKETLEAQKLS